MLCYFASIKQIVFSEVLRKEGKRYQVKLILANDPAAEQPIIFTFDSKLTSDTVIHTLEGYCKLSPDLRNNLPANERAPLLSNGCPFRLVDIDKIVKILLFFDTNLLIASIVDRKNPCQRLIKVSTVVLH